MKNKILIIMALMSLILLSGCNNHSTSEDILACEREGYDYYSSSKTNIVKCKDKITNEIVLFDYRDLDYSPCKDDKSCDEWKCKIMDGDYEMIKEDRKHCGGYKINKYKAICKKK